MGTLHPAGTGPTPSDGDLRRHARVLEAINRVFREALTCRTEEELGRTCLAVAEELTESRFGFLGELNPATGRMDDIAISDPGWETCRMDGPTGHGRGAPDGFRVHGIYGRVIQDGRGFFTNDPDRHPDHIGAPAGHPPLEAFLGVPLVQGGRTVGLIALGNRPGGYGPAQQEMLEALAVAVVQVLFRVRAEASLREVGARLDRQVRAFELLAATAGDLLASRRPQAIVERLCRRVMGLLDCQIFVNYLVDAAAGRLVLNATAGVPAAEVGRIERLDFGAAVCGCVARDGCRIVAERIPDVPDSRTDLVRSWGIRAYACHPLLGTGGEVMGTVSFGTRTRDTFGESDLALMKAVTDQVAVAMSRVRDEASIRESESFYRQTLESIPGMVFTTRPDGYCDFQSQQWVEFTGVPKAKHLGDGWNRLLHPDDRPRAMAAWSAAVAGRAPYDLEYRVRRHDGGFEWFKVHGRPIKNAAGEIVRWFGVATNIDGLKRAEEALRRLNEDLEARVAERTAEAGRLTGQLRGLAAELSQAEQRERKRLARVLHDHVQQLLVAAQMQLSLVRRDPGSPAAAGVVQGVESILKEAVEASRSLTVELSPPVLQEAGLLGGLHWLAARMGERQAFRVDVKAVPGAEPGDEETRFLLFECVRELLLNALKHSGAREASVRLERDREGRARVVVEDRGRGFDPVVLGRRRADDPTFGLFSIEQRLAHLGGRMDIAAAPGRGTRVTLTVPLAAAPHPSGETRRASSPSMPVLPPVARGERIRVLLVDDHRIVRQGLVSLLGVEPDLEVVGEAADGAEAVRLAGELRPRVVVMDVNLPVMGGVESTRRILRHLPGTKVVALSMHLDDDVARSMREAGASAYLTKGGPLEDLIAAIRACG